MKKLNLSVPMTSQIRATGSFPAYVSKLEVKELTVKTGAKKKVFKTHFKLADEVKDMEVNKWVLNEETKLPEKTDEMMSAEFMVGNTYRCLNDVWLTPEPADNEKWKNKEYGEYFLSLGAKFTMETIKGEERMIIDEVEESDILGRSVIVNLVEDFYKKDGVKKRVLAVGSFKKGELPDKDAGEMLDQELPF